MAHIAYLSGMKHLCELTVCVFELQQNPGRRFSTRELFLSTRMAKAAVLSKAVVLLLLFRCLLLLPLFVGVLCVIIVLSCSKCT